MIFLIENTVFISHDLVCYKFTTAERCKNKNRQKIFGLFGKYHSASGAVVTQFI